LRRSVKVFFQNDDDRQLFISGHLVRAQATALLPGSGIDLKRFAMSPLQSMHSPERPFRFLLIARMLWEKGVGEFAQAARLIRTQWPNAECCLLGFLDVQNPGAISRADMDALVAMGVTYLGACDDVRPEIAAADCIVLPSYREGTPRSLLEAAAMGRPIVATDVAGCREVVDHGVNGYLCKVRDAPDLAQKMSSLLSLTYQQRKSMGQRGREKIERQFDEQIVIGRYLSAIEECLSGSPKPGSRGTSP